MKSLLILTTLLLSIHGGFSFHLPDTAPRDFQRGDLLKVVANKLTSTKTQLPYSYYTLPYCRTNNTTVDSNEILPYVFKMREGRMCNILCRIQLDAKSVKVFREKIQDEYRVNMNLDNLPLVISIPRFHEESSRIYRQGYSVGLRGMYSNSLEEKYFINNHMSFKIEYDRDLETNSTRIVGFEVKPFSVKHEYEGEWNEETRLTTCDPHAKYSMMKSESPQEVYNGSEVIFTYDVQFHESKVKWVSRWDTYLNTIDDPVHWFSILISLMIIIFLSGIVAMILLRTVYRELSNYNELESREETQEETGWKLIHTDVFRPPIYMDLLCAHVGVGVQFFMVILAIMILAALRLISPSHHSSLMTTMFLLWIFMGLFAGYASARLYKMLNGTDWKKIAFRTAVVFPALLFTVLFLFNALNSPFGTMLAAIVLLWFGISVPLVYLGSYIGLTKKPTIESPVKTNRIPRPIPDRALYRNPVFTILIGGIFPFGVVFIEYFFILISVWLNQFYNGFYFLFIAFVILIVICAEISILFCYFQLCGEDHRWWWRSFLTTGSSGLYLFLYAIYYFFTRLEITKLVSVMLYFGYMLVASYVFFVLTGTIGFLACLWFTRLIYSSMKID